MNKKYLLGIDIGTYESKGVIVDREGLVLGQAAIPHELSLPRPGWAEHDADEVWWHDFCFLAKKLLAETGVTAQEIAAVGCSGIGPDLLPVDERGQPLRPAILYGIDTRATQEITELEQKFGSERILEVSGNSLSSQSVGPKILWLAKNEPEIFARTHRILTATGYLVYKLTGQAFIDTYTAATFAPLFNIHTLGWEPETCQDIIDSEILPVPAWPTQIAGELLPQASEATGLAAGTPVVVGTTDAAAEAVSIGVTRPGELMLMYGSTLFMIHVVQQLMIEPRLWTGVYLTPDTCSLAAGMATTGSLTRWFRDNFAENELADELETGFPAYTALSELATQIPPGSEGLLVLPYFSGERTPINDPYARGVIAGLTLSHTKAHIYRAILESVAYGIAHNLEVIKEAGGETSLAVAVGGGTKSRTWLQIVSDVTGVQQIVPEKTIGAAYGDAYLAGMGLGWFDRLEQVKGWVRAAERIQPDPASHKLYLEYYREYRDLYPKIKSNLHHLARLGYQKTS
jgi:xylulokinase